MKTIIHINQHKIKANKKNKKNDPVITCKTYKDNTYTNEVTIEGPCKIIYRPEKPLSCGATVWIETDSPTYCENNGTIDALKKPNVMLATNPNTSEVEEIELSEDDKSDLEAAADRLRQCNYTVTFKET